MRKENEDALIKAKERKNRELSSSQVWTDDKYSNRSPKRETPSHVETNNKGTTPTHVKRPSGTIDRHVSSYYTIEV